MQEYDIYNFIRSQEIREHFRKTRQMTTEEQIQLIVRSYEGIPTKINALRWLAHQSRGNDRALADGTANYLEMGYNAILHPDSDVIYLATKQDAPQRDNCIYKEYFYHLKNMLEPEGSTYSIHATFDEIIGFLEVDRDGAETIQWEAEVDMLHLPLTPIDREKNWYCSHDPEWSFLMSWMDGKWTIRSLNREEEWFLKRGIPEEVLDLVDWYASFSRFDENFTLPFERGSKVKIQTPVMYEPLIGIFDICETTICSFYYLCEEDSFPVEKSWDDVPASERVKDRHLCMSHQMIDYADHFCLFDWLERA